ncbi:MAG: DUF4124 domain-containing protein [Pseudomonadales bacterium]|nr:DUF4124 domain-containing protein [Pseudomonadales bacterium]
MLVSSLKILSLIIISSLVYSGDIYRYKDEKGRLQYTDSKPHIEQKNLQQVPQH